MSDVVRSGPTNIDICVSACRVVSASHCWTHGCFRYVRNVCAHTLSTRLLAAVGFYRPIGYVGCVLYTNTVLSLSLAMAVVSYEYTSEYRRDDGFVALVKWAVCFFLLRNGSTGFAQWTRSDAVPFPRTTCCWWPHLNACKLKAKQRTTSFSQFVCAPTLNQAHFCAIHNENLSEN